MRESKKNGSFSRSKGRRIEYAVRDALRSAGFVVDRVPASGASQGFKGDLRVKYDSKEILVEVKARRDAFKRLYETMIYGDDYVYFLDGVMFSYDPAPIVGRVKVKYGAWLGEHTPTRKLLTKLFLMRGDSDILVVKNDKLKPIYMSWITEENFEGRVVGNG